MLEGVDVDAAVVQCHVGGDVVGEGDDLDGQAVFLLGHLGRGLDQFGLGAGDGADFQGLALFLLTAADQYQSCQQRSRSGFNAQFHKNLLSEIDD
ncbi:hypothetical protein D3C84_475020 [compost metagenome]